MTRLVFALLPLAFVLPASWAAPVPKHLMKEPALYHPTEPGAKWVYRYYGYAEDEVGSDITEVLVAVFEPKGGPRGMRVAETGTVVEGKTHSGPPYTAFSSKGLVRGYMAVGGNFVPTSEPLRIAAVPGSKWEDAIGSPLQRTEKHTFRGEEVIEVPAGRFHALRVETENVAAAGSKRVWRCWYAPGVGMVRFEDSNGVRKVLKEFTPGGR
jgi:hypothetical protein